MTTLSAKQAGRAIELNRWRRGRSTSFQSLSTILDLSNLRALKERLSFIRDYPSFLVAIIVTLISVFLFISTWLMSKNLKTQVQKASISLGQQVQSLSATAISAGQMNRELEHLQALQEDANKIGLLAMQSTQRELLSYDVFPEPDPNMDFSVSVFHTFGHRFRSGVDKLIARVKSRDCPTEVEVNRALEESLLHSGRGGFASTALSRNPIQNGYGRYMSRIERTIIDEICKERAESISVYVNPNDLSGYEYWADYEYEGKEEAIKDCWYHQLAFWIIEDVFDTIDSMNSGSENVLTAPVKRLLDITFTMGLRRPRTGGQMYTGFRRRTPKRESGADKPTYILSAKDGLTETCTGRYCNEDIDVIHFSTSVLVRAEAVMSFMKELCSGKTHKFSGFSGNETERIFKHNQITILESNIKPINPMDNHHRLYRYGKNAVVELTLVCEYIFCKKGYDQIKPKVVEDEFIVS